ncbi:MAG: hypothetical protein JSS89_06200 [Bacteroidetes bacterium]|nr:hypothetical protein [Bacteroidota bacterium]
MIIDRSSGSPRAMAEISARSGSDVDPFTRGSAVTLQIRSVVDTTLTYTVRSIIKESDVAMIYVSRRGELIYWGEPYLLLRHSNPDLVRIGTTVVDSLTQY